MGHGWVRSSVAARVRARVSNGQGRSDHPGLCISAAQRNRERERRPRNTKTDKRGVRHQSYRRANFGYVVKLLIEVVQTRPEE